MSEYDALTRLLGDAATRAGDVARTRLGRDVTVAAAEPGASNALLRFDLAFTDGAKLSWYVSNEDATAFADLLIGGSGDRTVVLTEVHLDSLSGVFSDMLEQAMEGINAGLQHPLTAGGVDMGMEAAVPEIEPGGLRVAHSLSLGSTGQMVIVQQLDATMVALMAASLPDGALAGMPAPVSVHSPQPVAAPAFDNVVALSAAGAPASAGPSQPAAPQRDLGLLLNVPLPLTVELGRTQRTVRELLELSVGSIIELSKLAGDPLEIMVNGRTVARGEVVVIDEEFGVRVTEILAPEDRLRGLG